jgi:hypothetical protein
MLEERASKTDLELVVTIQFSAVELHMRHEGWK